MPEHRMMVRSALAVVLTVAACAPSSDGTTRDLARRIDFGSPSDEDLAVEEPVDLAAADLRKTKDLPALLADLSGVAVDAAQVDRDLAFPMTDLQVNNLAPGETCAAATVLPVGVLVIEQSTAALANDYDNFGKVDLGGSSTTCDSLTSFQYDAPDGIYKVDVPDGKTLRVQATSAGGWDLAVALFTDCAQPAASCKADADDALPVGNPEEVEYKNTTGATQTVYVLIDGWDTPESGTFTVQAQLL